MEKYKSFQISWIILIIIPLIIFWIYYLYIKQIGNHPITLIPMIIIECVLIFTILLLFGLKITITEDILRLSYGIGLIKIKIQLKKVKSTELVRNPWYYGLGIRIIPNGMLYNVHGLNAVELTFKEVKKVIRVGSSESERLKMEIDKRLE